MLCRFSTACVPPCANAPASHAVLQAVAAKLDALENDHAQDVGQDGESDDEEFVLEENSGGVGGVGGCLLPWHDLCNHALGAPVSSVRHCDPHPWLQRMSRQHAGRESGRAVRCGERVA